MKWLNNIIRSIPAFPGFARGYRIEGNEIILLHNISFGAGNSRLNLGGEEPLAYLKKYLDETPAITVLRVECHTEAPSDGSGSKTDEDFQLLSEQRALAVCEKLVELGVDRNRLVAVGFGGSIPIVSNDTYEHRVTNRRILFFNAEMNGVLIGGMPLNGGGKRADAR